MVAGYQAFYFFPLLMLESLGVRLASVQFLTSGRAKYPLFEAAGMVFHFAVYFILLFTAFNVWQALVFIAIHQSLMGLYMGSVFAPNHKGMLIPDPDANLGFLREQVLTTRNVRPHPLTDFWYGGLNYQIEHHLFPNMPRNKLKSARPIIKAFCEERSIPYYETSIVRSYIEVATYLHEVSRPMRTARPALT
jgi:fatty acid desaturase